MSRGVSRRLVVALFLTLALIAGAEERTEQQELARVEAASRLLEKQPWLKKARDALLDLLDSPHTSVQIATLKALWQHSVRSADTIDALVPMTRSPNPELREWGLRQLLVTTPAEKQELPILLQALHGTDPWQRRMAASAIGTIGPSASKALPDLEKASHSDDSQLRRAAIEAIASVRAGTPGALRELEAGVHDRDPEIRMAAARNLGQTKDATGLPILRELLDDPNPMVRATALGGIAQLLPNPDAIDIVVGQLARDDSRSGAWQSLWYHVKEPEPLVDRLIVEKRTTVQRALIEILGTRPYENPKVSPRALPMLRAALSDDSTRTRSAAARVIGYLRSAGAPAAVDLANHLRDSDATVRSAVRDSLLMIGPDAAPAFAVFVDILKTAPRDERRDAATAIANLRVLDDAALGTAVSLMGDRDARVRSELACAIREQRERGIAALSGALTSSSPEIRRAAARVLAMQFGRMTVQNGYLRAADTIAPLTHALHDPDAEVRRAAAAAIGTYSTAMVAAGPALLGAMNDPVRWVRVTAALSLRRVRGFDVAPLVAALGAPSPLTRDGARRAIESLYDVAADAKPVLHDATALRKLSIHPRFIGETTPPSPLDARFSLPKRDDDRNGLIRLRVVIAADGHVDDAHLISGIDPAANDRALAAAEGLRFDRGALFNNQAVFAIADVDFDSER